MRHSAKFFCLIAVSPVTQAIAFGVSAPTAVNPQRALNGNIPEPTHNPSAIDLRNRQANFNQETCGWVDGNYNSAVNCPGALTCMLYKSGAVGMAGCCSGSDSQDCGWSNSCMDAKAYAAGKCDSNCMLNGYVRKCTAAAAPYCVTWSYPSDGVRDYACTDVSSDTVYTVLQRGTDAFGDTTSIEIPTLSGNAVTGYETSEGGNNDHKTGKKIAIGLIVGVVVAGLFILFCVVIGVCCVLKKKKKQRQLAANAQAVAVAQANRPQSQYPPPPPPQMQVQQPQMQMQQPQMQMQQPPVMQPQQTHQSPTGYFSPPTHFQPPSPLEQKTNSHTSVHEYVSPSISSPPTPAPAYVQPQYSNVPAMPSSTAPAVNQHHNSETGAHEVDAISVPRPSPHGGPVYEIGKGR